MSENKKIKNTQGGTYDGIAFKSNLEIFTYKKLIEFGVNPNYEGKTFSFVTGDNLRKIIYYKSAKTKLSNKKILKYYNRVDKLTYTPDFSFIYKGCMIIYDVKGIQNDSYPIKKKLLFEHLEKNFAGLVFFFEPSNQSQVLETLDILRNFDKRFIQIYWWLHKLSSYGLKDFDKLYSYLESKNFELFNSHINLLIRRLTKKKDTSLENLINELSTFQNLVNEIQSTT